jgi:cytoskeletal protein RodZ
MKSLGEKLSAAREAKGYKLEDIARETNIALRYLAALEAEDFSGFSAEAYALGFLKNYGEYLGLDVSELLSLYRIRKIQEQPVPVEQLLKRTSVVPKILLIVFISMALLGGAGGGVFYLLSRSKGEDTSAVKAHEPIEYMLSGAYFEQRFYPDDTILVSLGDTEYEFSLQTIGDVVTITSPDGNIMLDLAQEKTLDLNGDGFNELRILTADFTKNNADMGALIRFELETSAIAETGPLPSSTETADGSVNLSTTMPVTVFNSANPYPFTLQAEFQGYCMFRWEILREANRQMRNEQYFSRGQELSIQAQNGVRLWTSNAQAIKIQAIGGGQTVSLNLGSSGEVIVADIQWVRDDTGRYRLVLSRLES